MGTMCVGVAALRTRTGWMGDLPLVSFCTAWATTTNEILADG
ncbi:MAG: hypothetical protein ACREXS_03660 [Gammaproteobacteria bacterium]